MATLTNQNSSSNSNPSRVSVWRRLVGWVGYWSAERHRRAVEDLLKHVQGCQAQGQAASSQSAAGALGWKLSRAVRVIAKVEAAGLLHSTARGLLLTEQGEHLAVSVIRAHRLWERYLADEAGMALTRVHAEANRLEHQREGDRVDQLDAALGYPARDPHGDPIPTADGRRINAPGTALTANFTRGQILRIVHIEDEPRSVFDQIVAMGLHVGQIVEARGSSARGLEVICEGRSYGLLPIVASNVFVEATSQAATPRASVRRLNSLAQGEQAVISDLDENLRGFHRRRLLDLGLTPGTSIRAERVSMFADPVAYRVRGSLVALRREQAESVLIGEGIEESVGL